MSPESIVSTGLSEASKKPRCTVVGDALSSWTLSSHCACAAAKTATALNTTQRAGDLMNALLFDSDRSRARLGSRPHTFRRVGAEFRRDLGCEQFQRRQRLLDPVPWRIMDHDRGGAGGVTQMGDLVCHGRGRTVQDD